MRHVERAVGVRHEADVTLAAGLGSALIQRPVHLTGPRLDQRRDRRIPIGHVRGHDVCGLNPWAARSVADALHRAARTRRRGTRGEVGDAPKAVDVDPMRSWVGPVTAGEWAAWRHVDAKASGAFATLRAGESLERHTALDRGE